jgi:hypothetical protein
MENARLLGELRQRTNEVAELNRGLEARVAAQVEELGRVGRLKRFLAPQLAKLRVRRNRWLGNACGAGTMLHGAPTVHLGIKHFQGPAAGVGWQRACDVII